MARSIELIKLFNSQYQLNHLPVGEDIEVLFSAEPELSNYTDVIKLTRVTPDQTTPNLGDIFAHNTSYLDDSKYQDIPFSYRKEVVQGGHKLVINPSDNLLPNSNYYLSISKDLAPIPYSLSKSVSLGPSSIDILVSHIGNNEDANFVLEVTQQSALSSSAHNVKFKLTKNSTVVLDKIFNIRSDLINLNDTLSIKCNPNVPFLLGETFNITTYAITRLPKTYIQKIDTVLDSELIESPVEVSTRVSQESILKFYEENAWIKNSTGQEQSPASSTEEITYKFLPPNSILIEFASPFNAVSITDSVFNIDINEAFDNYLLGQLGLYSDSSKYIIQYKIIGNNKIKLNVKVDTANIVPANSRYLVEAI